MKTFLKIVGGLALGFVVFEVLIGLLHALFAVAVVGVSLFVFGAICILAVLGLLFLIGGLVSRAWPADTRLSDVKLARRRHRRADHDLRELERKMGPKK